MRTLIRSLLLVALVLAAGFFLFGYWANSPRHSRPSSPTSGTSGVIDTERARERGAELGEKTAVVTERVREGITDSSLTAKIKAKMALDDRVQARSIDVTTSGRTVTLRGQVRSASERDRVLALARETAGVDRVIDELTMTP